MQRSEVAGVPVEGALPGVLVVDDEPAVCSLLELMLSRAGLTVWSASDGREAVEVYRRHRERIGLVLLDVQMPRLDGPAALAEMRRLDPALVALFTTGYMGAQENKSLLALGAAAVLRKPFALESVVRLVRDLLGGVTAVLSPAG